VINPVEAKQAKDIFRRFLTLRSTIPLAKELNDQGFTTKAWTTNKGRIRQGGLWTKGTVHRLLSNRKYIGEITHHGQVYPGEHEAIIDRRTWDQVQAIFRENNRLRGNSARCRTPAILKGLLRCGHCDGAFGITYSNKSGRNYRYYHCVKSTNSGDVSCPIPNVPAAEIESAVVSQLREILRAPETLAAAHQAWAEQGTSSQDGGADVNVDGSVAGTAVPDQKAFAQALADINAVWDHLFPAEQVRICRLLIDKATLYPDRIDLRLKSCGVKTLVTELTASEPKPRR